MGYLYQLLLRFSTIVPLQPGDSEKWTDSKIASSTEENDALYLNSLRTMGSSRDMSVPKPFGLLPTSSHTTLAEDVGSDEGSLECWAIGFTPEFCCNIDQFGPSGNKACWDGPYTFE